VCGNQEAKRKTVNVIISLVFIESVFLCKCLCSLIIAYLD
jgi:hypothetical protein